MKFSTFSLFVGALAATTKPVPSESASTSAAKHTLLDAWTVGVAQLPNIANDSAVDANAVASGYTLGNVTTTKHGLTALLSLKKATDIYGYDFETLNLTVEYQADTRLNVRIEPTNLTDVYILPESLVPKPKLVDVPFESELLFSYGNDNQTQFWFEVSRQSGEVLFSTKGNPLVFSNQFIQLNSSLPENYTNYGLGESIHGLLNGPGDVKTLWSNDIGDPIDGNIYGVHPVYYDQRYDSNSTHAVYWRTSAAQEVVFGNSSVTWRSLSGIVDLYFFSGPTPKDCISQYVTEIGLPAMQSYWTLGYQQSRWGYDSVDVMKEVVEDFKNADIPLEVIWNDLDYMDEKKDFTVGFPHDEFTEFLNDLQDNNQHYIPLIDAAIYHSAPGDPEGSNPGFELGEKNNVWLKNPDGTTYIGAVWPGFTVFPDFLNNATQSYWNNVFKTTNDLVPIFRSGVWLDMQEASSFCVGSCGTDRLDLQPIIPNFGIPPKNNSYPKGFEKHNKTDYERLKDELAKPDNSTAAKHDYSKSDNGKKPGRGNINYPPYVINNYQGDHDLATHGISPNATHADGTLEYDVHNLYGFTNGRASYEAHIQMQKQNKTDSSVKRPFLISRAAFAGSGKYAGHWGGDNTADYAWMYFSIPQAFTSGAAGIPFFGVDICGFNQNTDYELCSRWMALGSFMPFFRNHNVLGAIDQEPYRWSSVAEASRKALKVRYSLLPYFYTLLHQSHNTGVPLVRPFMWEWPFDESVKGADNQLMVGEALIVTPVLEPDVSKVKGVFPGALEGTEVYYDWYTNEKLEVKSTNTTLDAPLTHIPVHIRGGYVLPLQQPGYTTAESRNNSFELIVALDKDGKAEGSLYLDDGESLYVKSSRQVQFTAIKGKLSAIPFGDYKVEQPLNEVKILGASKPKQVKFNNRSVKFQYTNGSIIIGDLEKLTKDGAYTEQWSISWK